ncbi:MAG: FUSC family protein [Sarcina sp.]
MKLNKGQIMWNTIIFIFILIFVKVTSALFGEANQIVGVAVVTSALAFIQRDLTISPVENLLKLIALNIFTGAFASLALINPWIGIPVNFLSLFIIGYFFSSKLKDPLIIPIGFQYLFMLYSPVQGRDFILRIGALIFGAFATMAIQFVFNKGKVEKTFIITLKGVLLDLKSTIEEGKDTKELALAKINNMKKVIYESRKHKFFLSEGGEKFTNIICLLERITLNLNKEKLIEESKKEEFLNGLNNLLERVDKKSFSDLKIDESSIYKSDLEFCVNKLVLEIKELENIEIQKSDCEKKDIPDAFTSIRIFKDNFKKDTLKVSYGFKLAILLTIAAFIVDIMNISEGRWVVYTMFSLLQPYLELTKQRARYRIEGTILGAILVLILFSFITNPMLRGLIVLGAGYCNPYAKHYRSLMIIVTTSVLADMGVTGNTLEFAVTRLLFVVIGAITVVIASKYICPYKLSDGNEEIKNTCDMIIDTMNYEIENDNNKNTLRTLYLLPAFFETRVNVVNSCPNEIGELKKFFNEKRKILNNIYTKFYYKEKEKNENIFIDQ